MRRLCDSYLLDSASLASPAMDNVCWHAPVFPSDVLSARSTVMASRPMASQPGVGLVQSKRDVLNQHGVVMLSMQGWGMCRRRVPAACACCVSALRVPAACARLLCPPRERATAQGDAVSQGPAFVASSSLAVHTLPDGTRIRDSQITGVIGEGGLGIAYLAADHALARRVVIEESMPSAMAARSA